MGEEDSAILLIKPAENHKQPEHSAGRIHLQEPHQISQPVLSDLLLKQVIDLPQMFPCQPAH